MGNKDFGTPKGYVKRDKTILGFDRVKQYDGRGRCVGERVNHGGILGDSNYGTMKKNKKKFW